MKKQTKSNWQKQLALTAVAIFAFLFAAQIQIAAQGKIKAGDRVAEVWIDGGGVRWKGKVIEISTIEGCYVIRQDTDAAGVSGTQTCPIKGMSKIVPLNKNDKPILDDEKTTEENEEQPKNEKPKNEKPKTDKEDKKGDGFQPGDRVEVQVGWTWKKATIVANEVSSNKAYVVLQDDDPGRERRFGISQVRALQNPGEDDGGKKIKEEAERNITEAKALCSGEPLAGLRTKGRPASAELFSQVIRAAYDRPEGALDYKKVSTIDQIEVGKPYKDGAITVYPVKVDMRECTDEATKWSISVRKNYRFILYVDPAKDGEWTAGIYQSGTGDVQIIYKPEANKMTLDKPKKP